MPANQYMVAKQIEQTKFEENEYGYVNCDGLKERLSTPGGTPRASTDSAPSAKRRGLQKGETSCILCTIL